MKYRDLYEVLFNEPEAQDYYDKLPDYVRKQIKTRANNVNSLSSLQDYAENLTRGDG